MKLLNWLMGRALPSKKNLRTWP